MKRQLPLLLLMLLLGCHGDPAETPAPLDQPPGQAPGSRLSFEDVTVQSGLSFDLERGATGERYMIETSIGGLAWIDHDGDGDLDLYVANGHEQARVAATEGNSSDRLFENIGEGRFVDATERAGIDERRYSQGVAVADYDNDGNQDLLITNYGRNTLYRNTGSGRFEDVTIAAGLLSEGYHTGAAWLDHDRDGDLDLYIARYLDYDTETAKPCHNGALRVYCHPKQFRGQSDLFYESRGDGTFTEVGVRVGVAGAGIEPGKGLGVLAADLDGDDWTDVYVACDTTPNLFFRNRQDGTFRECAAELGLAYDTSGRSLAGMGIDCGDVNSDGRLDLHVTNFAKEPNQLLCATEDGVFEDTGARMGLGSSFAALGFGTALADLDNDGALDLLIANGHIDDRIEEYSSGIGARYAQEISLYLGSSDGGFEAVHPATGPLSQRMVGRGLAVADHDDDGDLDVALITHDRGLVLLRTNSPPENHYLDVRLIGRQSPRDAIGSRVLVRVGGRLRAYSAGAPRSYLSSADPRVHIGLGAASRIDEITVRWTSGAMQTFEDLAVDRVLIIEEP